MTVQLLHMQKNLFFWPLIISFKDKYYTNHIFFACCGFRMFIPDPTFFHPESEFFPSLICIKEFKYFNPKMVSKLQEIWSRFFNPDPDPDFLPISDPGSRGQKGTGSRIRNTGFFESPYITNLLVQVFFIFKGTQEWEFFWLRFWNLYFFVDS